MSVVHESNFYTKYFKIEHFTAIFKKILCDNYGVGAIDLARAKTIALKFFEQYNSSVTFKSASLEGEVWIITLEIGLINRQTRRILIDRSTGNIQSVQLKKLIHCKTLSSLLYDDIFD